MTATRENVVRPAIEEAIAVMTAALVGMNTFSAYTSLSFAEQKRLILARDRLLAALDYLAREAA